MRILYLIHHDWGWTKQRSQFIAEQISQKVELCIIYRLEPKRGALVCNKRPPRCFGMPFSPVKLLNIGIVRLIDQLLFSTIIRIIDSFLHFDVIIVTHPVRYRYVTWHSNVVYDLHDDNEESYPDNSFHKAYVSKWNQIALRSASLTLFSSQHLHNKYSRISKKSALIRNGHGLPMNTSSIPSQPKAKNELARVFYFGTVAKWFDMDLIVASLSKNPYIEYHIIGPSDVELVRHPRVHWYGPLQHDNMCKVSENADCFIMPFRVTPLIEAVDPVKLYEYIALRRPIITVYYDEISYLEPFVYFYNTQEEFFHLLERLIQKELPAKGDDTVVLDFLKKSSWTSRADMALDNLEV